MRESGAEAEGYFHFHSEPPDLANGLIRKHFWTRGWLPLLGNNAGDHYCVDLGPGPRGRAGQMIDWGHELGPWAVEAADFVDLLERHADAMEGGQCEEYEDFGLSYARDNDEAA